MGGWTREWINFRPDTCLGFLNHDVLNVLNVLKSRKVIYPVRHQCNIATSLMGERYREMGVKLYADLFLFNQMEAVSSHGIIFWLFVRCGRRCCIFSIIRKLKF